MKICRICIPYKFELVIDCHLSWYEHIEYICTKISKNINVMTKVKKYLSKQSLINMYYSHLSLLNNNIVLHSGVTIITIVLYLML